MHFSNIEQQPLDRYMNEITSLSHDENAYKRHLVTRLAAVAIPCFAVFNILYHAIALAIKLPVFLTVRVWIDLTQGLNHQTLQEFNAENIAIHAYLLTASILSFIVAVPLGLISPVAVIKAHSRFHLTQVARSSGFANLRDDSFLQSPLKEETEKTLSLIESIGTSNSFDFLAKALDKNPEQMFFISSRLQLLVENCDLEKFDEIIAIADKFNEWHKSLILESYCEGLVKSSHFEAIERVADKIPNKLIRSGILESICIKLFEKTNYEEAIRVAQKLLFTTMRSEILARISQKLLEQENYEEAIRVAQKIPFTFTQSDVLAKISQKLLEQENYEEAIRVAQLISFGINRCSILAKIAEKNERRKHSLLGA